jgi:hypothetical protein
VVRFEAPKLNTRLRKAGRLHALLPADWIVGPVRKEDTIVPAESVELTPPGLENEDASPRLTLTLVRLSMFPNAEIEIEGIDRSSDVNRIIQQGGPHATIMELDDNMLVGIRVTHLGRDLITMTYAAPDYLFETKEALDLLDTIAHSIELTP